MATNWYRDRREAEALERSLERFESLVSDGTPPEEAIRAAASGLEPALARLLALSAGVRLAAAPAPEPSFAATFEDRLRAARVVRRFEPRRRVHTPGLATLAAAACVALLAGVLFSASHSLPGDALYGVKKASEAAQVALASGPVEARMRLGFAEKRLDEVEGLVNRARGQVVGVPGTSVASAVAADFSDPTLAELIRDTLEEAELQITTAATILINDASDAESLGKLADIAHKGSTIANDVAQDLPEIDKPPVIDTAVAFASVETQAKAALSQLEPIPTIPPCDTPTPAPTPSETPTSTAEAEPTEPTATPASSSPAPTASPSASPASPTPSPTPCISPSPDPDATPSPTPEPTSDPDSVETTDTNQEASRPFGGPRDGSSEGDQGSDGNDTP